MAERILVSRLGVHSQTVVPKAVREVLCLAAGDRLGYVIKGCRVELVKMSTREAHSIVCFDEWSGEADSKGYGSL